MLLFRKNPKQKVPRYKVRFQAFAELHRLVYHLAYGTEKKEKKFESLFSIQLALSNCL